MKKVAIVGNGNWGSAIAKIIANNIIGCTSFDPEVLLWVHEEIYQNQKLSEYINAFKLNPIYLPGIKLPQNLLATTDFDLINNADIIVICLPTRFLDIIRNIKPKEGTFAINLSKGLIFKDQRLYMPSEYIRSILKIDCACLMGPNIAIEVATDSLSECTVGYTNKKQLNCLEWMFDSHYFKPKFIPYDIGIEICGGLKNVISIGFGIADGMEWGSNTKAIVFRKGLVEIERFSKVVDAKFLILESCCIGDLLTSCLSGRNFRCGVEIAKSRCKSDEVEKNMNGQKLEGPETVKIIHDFLEARGIEFSQFPVFQSIYGICFLGASPEQLYEALKKNQ
ncbi:hypothetical protein GINT2_000274 [Glugoides intestinalis]